MTSASPLGAEMMTRFAPPFRCSAAFSRAVKRPVDSITTSTPLSPHGISAGSRTSSFLISRAVDREAAVGLLDLVRDRAADRVVLQEERHRVGVAEGVVDRHQLDPGLGAAGEDRPVERAADPAESVDPDSNGHDILPPVEQLATSSSRSRVRLQQSRGPSPLRAVWRSAAGDVAMVDCRPGSRLARAAGRAGRRSRRCGAGRRCSRPRSTGTPCPPARNPGNSRSKSRSSSSRNSPCPAARARTRARARPGR